MLGSYGVSLFAVYKTLEISFPTVVEALFGREMHGRAFRECS